MSSPRPPATGTVVTGSRIAPPAAARPRSATSACLTAGPDRSWPVITTSAGDGPSGKACWMRSMVRTTARPLGASMAG